MYRKLVICLVIALAIKARTGNTEESAALPPNSTTLRLCPCVLGDSCHETFYIPVKESFQSKNWYLLNSNYFLSSNSSNVQCKEKQLRLTFSEGSFAMLPSGDLMHIHGKLIVGEGFYCLKKSYNENYVIDIDSTSHYMLEAEACVSPPVLPYCCDEHVAVLNSSALACTAGEGPPPIPQVHFDGSDHDWMLDGNVKGYPPCDGRQILVPLGRLQGHGSLHFVSGELQLRWQPSIFKKTVIVDEPEFCIGHYSRYDITNQVAAICSTHENPEESCLTSNCYGKCCPAEQVFDIDFNECQTSSFMSTWTPTGDPQKYSLVYGMPSCKTFYSLNAANPSHDNFEFISNGSLVISSKNEAMSVPNYCFDFFRNQTHLTSVALVCFEEAPSTDGSGSYYSKLYSVLLYLTSCQLFVSATLFFALTLKKRPFPVDSDVNIWRLVEHSTLLVCAFMVCSACEVVILASQQMGFKNTSIAGCIFVERLLHTLSLTSMGYLFGVSLQQRLALGGCSSCNATSVPRVAALGLYLGPLLLAVVTVTASHFIAPFVYDSCPVQANTLTGPWAAYLQTGVHALLLVGCFLSLFWRCSCCCSTASSRHDADTAPEQREPTATDGGPPADRGTGPEGNVRGPGSTTPILKEQKDGLSSSEQPRGCSDTWWVSLKLVALETAFFVPYLAVWQHGAPAFWVFVDIALVLKFALVSGCVLRQVLRCPRSGRAGIHLG